MCQGFRVGNFPRLPGTTRPYGKYGCFAREGEIFFDFGKRFVKENDKVDTGGLLLPSSPSPPPLPPFPPFSPSLLLFMCRRCCWCRRTLRACWWPPPVLCPKKVKVFPLPPPPFFSPPSSLFPFPLSLAAIRRLDREIRVRRTFLLEKKGQKYGQNCNRTFRRPWGGEGAAAEAKQAADRLARG